MIKPLSLLASLLFSANALAGLLVTEVTGKAEIEGKGPVATLAEIPDGTRLSVNAGSHIVAVDLASGREFILKGNAKFSIAADGPKTADGKPVEAKPLPAKNLPDVKVATSKVAQATLVMRSMRKFNVPVLNAPARTTVITTRPLFQWGSVEGAARYRLILKGQEGSPLWEAIVAANEFAPTEDRALHPEGNYVWRIEALGADGRAISDASASFSVASAAVISRLDGLKPAADAPFGRRVLYAAQVREAGAVTEAKLLWKALAMERPDDEVLKTLAE